MAKAFVMVYILECSITEGAELNRSEDVVEWASKEDYCKQISSSLTSYIKK